MIILQIFCGWMLAGFNISWFREAHRDNGNFDKKEIVQWLLGNMAIGLFYNRFVLSVIIDQWIWAIILGSLIGSVGIQLYFEKNDNKQKL